MFHATKFWVMLEQQQKTNTGTADATSLKEFSKYALLFQMICDS